MTQLKHYGVKGMRWGVRRSEEELADADSGEGAGGGGFEEEMEGLAEDIQDFADKVIDEASDIALSAFEGLKDITDKGKKMVDDFINKKRIAPNRIKKELPAHMYKNNPKAQQELLRYTAIKSKLDKEYKSGKISRKDYKDRIKGNDKLMKRNAYEARKAFRSKTTIYVDTVKEVRYSIKGNAGLNSHVAGSSNR